MSTEVWEIRENKAKYRSFLQDLGTLLGFDEGGYVEQCLVEQAITETPWNRMDGFDKNIVFDNVRTQAQFQILKDYGFTLVRLLVDPEVQVYRALAMGVSADELSRVQMHGIENPLKVQDGEIQLNATYTTEDIAAYLVDSDVLRRTTTLS